MVLFTGKKNIPQFLKTFYIKSLYKRLEFRLGTLTDDLDRIKKKKKRFVVLQRSGHGCTVISN